MFAMACWSSRRLGWERMDEGAAASHWRPRATADEAIAMCLRWTGRIGIPAMQVIDLEEWFSRKEAAVIWRDSRYYPDAGPTVPAGRHEWEKVSSGALDPAALEVGAEKNLIHPESDRAGWLGSPRCEFHEGLHRCRGGSVGPFDHYCHRHWFPGCDDLWPQPDPAEQLALYWWDGDVARPNVAAAHYAGEET